MSTRRPGLSPSLKAGEAGGVEKTPKFEEKKNLTSRLEGLVESSGVLGCLVILSPGGDRLYSEGIVTFVSASLPRWFVVK